MSPVELIFVLLGVGILIASCFVGGKEKKSDATLLLPEEVLEGYKQEINTYAERIMEEKSEEVVIRTDDYLSKISNEKIMSVNDFSTQILEKIDTNHKEVVFLYDMLNKKEDEIKQTVQQFDKEKQEMQEVVGDIIKLTKQMKASIQKSDEPKSTSSEKGKKTETKRSTTKTTVKAEPAKTTAPVKAIENQEDGQLEFAELMQADRRQEEVLKLHKQGKSVLEISKMMGMGQGEVKLIVDLYGA
ncbi:MAG: hypothetical protein J6C07_02630 [Lachnospiraceae bacterium]|nr:hypothetical protein [Lachnospiraceae bacterium]